MRVQDLLGWWVCLGVLWAGGAGLLQSFRQDDLLIGLSSAGVIAFGIALTLNLFRRRAAWRAQTEPDRSGEPGG